MITAPARAAILDAGLPGLLTLGGGSLQVRLINGSSEASGNGYSRQRFSEWELATQSDVATIKNSAEVDFTASGGSISYDRLEVWNRAGTTRYLRSEYLGAQSIASGVTRSIAVQFATQAPPVVMFDATKWNQLSAMYGRAPERCYFAPGLEPYLTEAGEIYTGPAWIDAFGRGGQIMVDYEPNAQPYYGTGTIAITNGVVTLTDGTFPNYGTNPVYKLRLYVGGVGALGAREGATLYMVAARNDGNHLTLVDTSVNVPAGTVYKFTAWQYREIDPKFASSDAEWQGALDEVAYAVDEFLPYAEDSGAVIGFYDLLAPIQSRYLDIIGTTSFTEWQEQTSSLVNYRNAQGWTFGEKFRDGTFGYIWANRYVSDLMNATPAAWGNFNTATQRITETLEAQGVRCCPLFLRHTIEGYGTWAAGGSGAEVDRDLLQSQIEDANSRGPFAVWGDASDVGGLECRLNEADGFVEWLGDTVAAL